MSRKEYLEKIFKINDFSIKLWYNVLMTRELKELAEVFSPYAKLYVVGGAVRDRLFGLPTDDYDIVSAMRVEQLMLLPKIKIELGNKSLGSAKIVYKGKSYDYTTLRQEVYDKLGKHVPTKVEFVTDLRLDSLRRDFTINAIYYDISADTYVDFHNGLEDINNRIIRAIPPADKTMAEDGARIFRMVRFALMHDCTIDKETLTFAQKNIDKINLLSNARIQKECKKIEKITKNIKKYEKKSVFYILKQYKIDIKEKI